MDFVDLISGQESLLAKRKDSTILAILSTHSSHPFKDLHLRTPNPSLPKFICS